jgi:1-acyl-sn-glycerol-3-phosphate acyltransferase
MKLQSLAVPAFGVGQIKEPLAYIAEALPLVGERLGLYGAFREEFVTAGLACAYACIPLLQPDALHQGQIESIPEARAFWNLVGDHAVSQESSLTGAEHLAEALRLRKEGFNVVVVQNHRSGADMLVMETLIRRHLDHDACADWAYMSGHVINLYLVPAIFAAALRRFQIFSVKYQTTGVAGLTEEEMRQQNKRAMESLRACAAQGGTVTVYYPEGGRGTGGMKQGEARTSCIPRNIANSKKPLVILPTNVAGTESLLPQHRGENEFNEVLHHMRAGTAHLAIGKPIHWEELCAPYKAHFGNRVTWNTLICDTLLALVAHLGPAGETGHYTPKKDYVRALLEHFPEGGDE